MPFMVFSLVYSPSSAPTYGGAPKWAGAGDKEAGKQQGWHGSGTQALAAGACGGWRHLLVTGCAAYQLMYQLMYCFYCLYRLYRRRTWRVGTTRPMRCLHPLWSPPHRCGQGAVAAGVGGDWGGVWELWALEWAVKSQGSGLGAAIRWL